MSKVRSNEFKLFFKLKITRAKARKKIRLRPSRGRACRVFYRLDFLGKIEAKR